MAMGCCRTSEREGGGDRVDPGEGHGGNGGPGEERIPGGDEL